ncbi:MAG TPA: ATP-binding protein [Longimicrobiales bacterium]
MTLRSRLVASIGGIAVLVVLPALYGASRLARLRDIAEDLHRRHAAAFLALGRLQANLADVDRYERSYIVTPAADARDAMNRALQAGRRELQRLDEAGYGDVTRGTRTRLDTLEASTRQVQALMQSKRTEEATRYFDLLKPRMTAVQDSLDNIAAAIDRRSGADVVNAQEISAAATTTTLLGTLAAILVAVFWGLWATEALTRPLRRLQRATSAVAGGEFVVPPNLPYTREDEIGELARSFRWMTLRLAELDRLKAEFISIATHELKTPINVIGGYSELLETGVYGTVSEKQQEVIASVREQTRVLTRLVNQLLDMSRLEAGGLRMEVEGADLAGLLNELRRSFEPLARQKHVDLVFTIEPSTPRQIPLDAARVREQLLGNLLSNALKFTPEGGRIRVRSWGEADGAMIEVSDTGVGIPPEKLPHIFDKFYQVGAEARSKGAGLGLSIAREIAEAHGGHIEALSEPGRGTTFRITLPLRPVPAPAAALP